MFLRYNQFSISIFIVILLLCLLPGTQVPCIGQENLDKFLHGFLFALLSFTMMVGFLKQYQFRVLALNASKIVIVFGLSYGIVIEVLQDLFLPDRSFEWLDILADGVGTVLGFSLFLWIKGNSRFV